MDIKYCRICGKMMQYSGFGAPICMACNKMLDEKFKALKAYLKEHPRTTMNELSEAAGVPISQINKWVREERLTFAEDSPIGIDCEKCGRMIKSGKYCQDCKNKLVNELSSGRKMDEPEKRNPLRKDASARMRFLDR